MNSPAVTMKPITVTREDRVNQLAARELERLLANREAQRRLLDIVAEADFSLGHPISYVDFLAQQYDTPAYRIDGLWPVGGTALLAAYRKTGKSTMVQNAIYSIATGSSFLGCQVVPLEEDESIVHLNLEVSERSQQAYAAYFQPYPNVYIYNLRGEASKFNILSDAIRSRIALRLADYNTTVLVVDPLGPLLRAFGLDENKNSSDGGGAIVEALNELAAEAGISENLLIHHTGHGSQWRARGSSVFGDAPDVLWNYRLGRHKMEEADDEEAANIDPNARYFSATGRLDNDFDEQRVYFDERTHRLTLKPSIL